MPVHNSLTGFQKPIQPVLSKVRGQTMPNNAVAVELAVFNSFSDAEADWQQLKDVVHSSPYQSPQWLEAWLRTLGKTFEIDPVIAVVRRQGRPLAIFPMGLHTSAGIRTLSFLGHQNGNQNTGILGWLLLRQGSPFRNPGTVDRPLPADRR